MKISKSAQNSHIYSHKGTRAAILTESTGRKKPKKTIASMAHLGTGDFAQSIMDIIGKDRGGNSSHFITWYSEPYVWLAGQPLDRLTLGLRYLHYTKGIVIDMTLLIPDRDRENHEDFIWCIPIERPKWNKWYALSEKFKTITPTVHGGGVRYMNRMEGKTVKTVLVMPNQSQTDDDAMTACAYLRMVKGITCRMYVVRCTDDPLKGARLIEKAAGCDATLVEEIELTPGEEDGTTAGG